MRDLRVALALLFTLLGCSNHPDVHTPCGSLTCQAGEVCVHLCATTDGGVEPPPVCRVLGSPAPGCDYMHRNCCDPTTAVSTQCDPNCFLGVDAAQAACHCGP